MTAAILEIRDGVAVGPLHKPVATGPGNLNQRFVDCIPLTWSALCGVRGYVYRREGLVEFDPDLKECFECRVAATATPKPPAAEELRARARTNKRRQRGSVVPPKPVICHECGGMFTPSKYARRDARQFCSRPCYFIDHWRRKRQEMAA